MHMNCDGYLKLAGYMPLLNCMFQYLLIKLRTLIKLSLVTLPKDKKRDI
jgi:hypothetical protein